MSESLADVVHEAVERAKADDERKPVLLTEFLLARIAEDRERATSKGAHWSECPSPSGGDCSCTGTLAARNRRALAECEAKRRIVALLTNEGAVGGPVPWDRMASANKDILMLLALPYAEHPDFDPSWRL